MTAAETGVPQGRPLLLAHLTLLHVQPPRMIELAAAAGYDGVSLHLAQEASANGAPAYSMLGYGSPLLAETWSRMRDTGVVVHDIQAVRLQPQTRIADALPLLEAGARLGARYLMTVCDDDDAARNRDRFGELAETAAPFGIQPVLEFMAYSGVRTLRDADRIVERCGHPNAAIMVDSLHWYRSGGTLQDIARVPARRMPYLQICDAPREAPPGGDDGLRHEARRDRLFPGEGGLPLAAFLGAFDPALPLSVEVPVRERQPHLDDAQIARRSIDATRRLLARLAEPYELSIART